MFDYLIQHAIQNVWCNPEQDTQHIFSPCRLTPSRGVKLRAKVMQQTLALPDTTSTFHLFQIGQLHPLVIKLLGLDREWITDRWLSFADSMNQRKMFVDIYTDSGVQLFRHQVYYQYTSSHNLLIAVKHNEKLPVSLGTVPIYVRVYTNAYFSSTRSDASIDSIQVIGRTITAAAEVLDIQATYTSYLTKPGYVYAFVNGLMVDSLDLFTVKMWDTVEMVYDSSIARVVALTVNELPTFNSILDSIRKYLVHPPVPFENRIDYQDDIDVYLTYTTNGQPNRYQGLYYHRNLVEAIRMVTHRDYSLSVSTIANLGQSLQTYMGRIIDVHDMTVLLFIRKSGYDRPLIFEHQRLHELYKLDDSLIQDALSGTVTGIPLWHAATLENSAYTRLMCSSDIDITRQLIQDAYGYNGIAKVIGDTPRHTQLYSGRQRVAMPYGLQRKVTVYEYDSDGKLLGRHIHDEGSYYTATSNQCRTIEAISGVGSQQPHLVFGTDQLTLPIYDNWRLYRCHRLPNGYLDEVWEDVTQTDLYSIVDGKVCWGIQDPQQFLMLRIDDSFLAYELNLVPIDAQLRFSLSEMENREGLYRHYVMPVPMGDLDIWLNGYSLIEDVDYYVRFPEVVIINKDYLTPLPNSTYQAVQIRFTGFCKPDLTREISADQGWIVHGVLSNNSRFDLRDDRVMRLVVNGRLKTMDDVTFSELHSGVSITDATNGQPYSLKDIVVPLKELTDETTYTLRASSQLVNTMVSDYMTLVFPEPSRDAISAIPQRYRVFSPFIAKILYDVLSGHLLPELYERVLTDQEVLNICHSYEDWLRFDPIGRTPEWYVAIHPHNHYQTVEIDLAAYRFMKAVVRLYGQGRVELSPFVTLNNPFALTA